MYVLKDVICLFCICTLFLSPFSFGSTRLPELRVPFPDFRDAAFSFSSLNDCRVEIQDSKVKISTFGKDPFLLFPEKPLPTPIIFHLKMKAQGAGTGAYFWRTFESPQWGQTQVHYFPILHDGQWHDYTFTIPTGILIQLRLDLGEGEGTYHLGALTVSVPDPSPCLEQHRTLTLDPVFSSDMVLQQQMPIPIRGKADAGQSVQITVGPYSVSTLADDAGQLQATLPAMKAGGPYDLVVQSESQEKITFKNILVGDVWLCAGQSNMEIGLAATENGAREIAKADYSNIRLLRISRRSSPCPSTILSDQWQVCTPETIARGEAGGFSAVAYYFGRELHQTLNIPIGLIQSAWGGTSIEPWIPVEGLLMAPSLESQYPSLRKKQQHYEQPEQQDQIKLWKTTFLQALKKNEPLPSFPISLKILAEPAGQASLIYNGMIHPLVHFPIRGIIWYQGESNMYSGDGLAYSDKMKALIVSLRAQWKQPEMPFYYVQIAPFRYSPDPYALPVFWQGQSRLLCLDNTGMAGTLDIGNLDDIHPVNKVDVGRRLARWALCRTYGRTEILCSGPVFHSMHIENDTIRVQFKFVGAGLKTKDGQSPNEFEIAGKDGVFAAAQAKIISPDTLLLWNEAVKNPVSARFAWRQDTQPNLTNEAGLCPIPFNTALEMDLKE